ncbi:SixA phosphatase family protein [Foetidibacter luteolus]|uniref:SixA phosphatase family protein n=1 Tax=Foetidibacter luteolus TaxID=2608880 RepID=UPI00129A62AE|nr:histidine phosphatase family protein [Foetidibacter luteolus]
MKQLLLVRHAKSSWDNPMLKDFDRPLNDRGHADAPYMAKKLKDKKIAIDAFISSPAKRAITTATYFAEAYGIKKDDIIEYKQLFNADEEAFLEVIAGTDDKFNCIAVFSHNPGISEFATELTTTAIDDMPTCSVFAVKVKAKSWKEFAGAPKEFWFFDYPKKTA